MPLFDQYLAYVQYVALANLLMQYINATNSISTVQDYQASLSGFGN
ncbi:hypothetical protein TOL_1002 [Thalassolituus oleivorans MIL-1]|uniref:Uncharacterized protein n=1 Tax=Thalassolituus oleivorans MIL-1 TaxID=1298593 RepID=M5DPL9_9GAMM|nr:hypothetical protein TOL_1002 [Thalassolituus oleivorans MIL-1]